MTAFPLPSPWIAACFGLGALVAAAQPNAGPISPPTKSARVACREVVDFRFSGGNTAPTTPFEMDFQADFTSPDGKTLVIPGFYDGDNQWVLRFSASIAGNWKFTTRSSLASLRGHTGVVDVQANAATNQRGAITRKASDPQRFYYEDGSPCTVLAFECDWLFALDYDNPSGTPKTDHLLDLLRSNGFNQVVTTVYSFASRWPKDPFLARHPEHEYGGRTDIYPFLGTNLKPDFSALNPVFFQRLDRTLRSLQRRGIAAHLMIYVWNKQVSWPGAATEADNRYFDYIIKRYQAFPNVVWDVSKEALNNPRCTEDYAVERIERIRALDAYRRLVSVHDYGFCIRHPEKVDFISWQNWSATVYHDMLGVRANFPQHPIFNIEHGGYERSPYVVFPGDYTDPEVCLRRNYLIMFAGGYSTYYWQGAAWNVIIHNPFEQPAEFVRPRFDYYRHLARFFHDHPYAEFQPQPEANASGYTLGNGRGKFLVYVPKENEKLSVSRKSPLAAEGKTIQWFNTLTGEYSPAKRQEGVQFTSPWRGEADSILVWTAMPNSSD